MTATRRTPAQIDAGLEGWAEGSFDEYMKAKQRLDEIGRRMLAWAVEVGHNAAEHVVPEWAKPTPIAWQGATVYDPVKEEKIADLLFDLETVPKRKPARTSKKARAARKAQRDVWVLGKSSPASETD